MRHLSVLIAVVVIVALAPRARAQPLPVPIPLPPPDEPPPDPPPPDPAPPDPVTPPAPPPPPPDDVSAKMPRGWDTPPPEDPLERAITPDRSTPSMQFPMIFTAPSGRMLPAAVIWSSSGVHTGGGLYSDLFVGLGDVAEFGIGVTDLIRVRPVPGDEPITVKPFAQASFKMGVGEDRLFRFQPAMALAFRKSFEHTFGSAKLRTASLYLMASKSLGRRVTLHGGGVLWDAALREPGAAAYFFHDQGVGQQLRPVVAIEAEPIDRSLIMIELNWVPDVQRAPAQIDLAAMLTWGVRYRITSLLAFESGVRIQGIDEANLLDAQIFGQLSWGSDRLRRAINRLR
jgi:hypothetical protein